MSSGVFITSVWHIKLGRAITRRQRGYRAIARRVMLGKEEYRGCGHVHHKRAAAGLCAKKLARDLGADVVF